MFCIKCGEKFAIEAQFCQKCGTKKIDNVPTTINYNSNDENVDYSEVHILRGLFIVTLIGSYLGNILYFHEINTYPSVYHEFVSYKIFAIIFIIIIYW